MLRVVTYVSRKSGSRAAAFSHLAPLTYVLTRSRSDFERNVLDIITQADCFDVLTCVKVDHDAATHQLRNLGPVPFATAAQGLNDDHYELLLRSRSFTRSDR